MLGTRNRKKREEIVAILGDLGFSFGDLSDRPDLADVVETGSTFEENARLKAAQYARATGEWTLAEDSGLVVPGLNGRPGVYSARYAGKQGDDAANNARLLAEARRRCRPIGGPPITSVSRRWRMRPARCGPSAKAGAMGSS